VQQQSSSFAAAAAAISSSMSNEFRLSMTKDTVRGASQDLKG
jgi:hypothetical protein